jgi:hypothetical protein
MKITKTRLKQILNEEVQAFLQEADGIDALNRMGAASDHGGNSRKSLESQLAQLEKEKKPIWDAYTKAVHARDNAQGGGRREGAAMDMKRWYDKATPIIKKIRAVRAELKKLIPEPASKKRRGGKGRAGSKRAALNRTFKKGVMPKGTGFSNFKDFYAALTKAGIKVKQDSHWGRRHYRAWVKLRGAMKGKGGLAGGTEISAKAAEMIKTGKGGPDAGASANKAQSKDARMASLVRSHRRLARMIKTAEKQGMDTTSYKKQLASIQKMIKATEAETGVDNSKELAQMAKDVKAQGHEDFSTNPERTRKSQAKLDKGAEEDVLNPGSKAAKAAAAKKAAEKAGFQKQIAAYEKKAGRKLTPKEIQTLKKTGVKF